MDTSEITPPLERQDLVSYPISTTPPLVRRESRAILWRPSAFLKRIRGPVVGIREEASLDVPGNDTEACG